MKSLLLFVGGSLFGAVILALVVGYFMVSSMEGCGKCKTARIQLKDIGIALKLYAEETGSFPAHHQGLKVLDGGVMRSLPYDPWGRDFHYTKYKFKGLDCFLVWSLGRDGAIGGKTELDADIFVSHVAGNCLTSQGSEGASRRDQLKLAPA